MANKYFIAVYTNEVKDYCDEKFFSNLFLLSGDEQVVVIDNTAGKRYFNRLQNIFKKNEYANFKLYHLNVPEHPKKSQFQRNVCSSAAYLRKLFLKQTALPYFLIIETDVYPPVDLLDKFDRSIWQLNRQSAGWGVIGGIYYPGFHNYDYNTALTTLEKTRHCLSGCTVYKRALIEKFPFRYDPGNLASFPDAFISLDSVKEFSLWNEHQIKCEHLHNPLNGSRVS